MFDAALEARAPGETDLVPFWLFPGKAMIERHVPRLPLSREEERLPQLRNALVLYRAVFGQPRQEDVVAFLGELGTEKAEALATAARVDLTPPE